MHADMAALVDRARYGEETYVALAERGGPAPTQAVRTEKASDLSRQDVKRLEAEIHRLEAARAEMAEGVKGAENWLREMERRA